MKNEAVFKALKQRECQFHAMMAELRQAASTLEGDDLLNAMTEVGSRYS